MKKRNNKGHGPIVLRAKLEGLIPDKPNKNGRIYPREILEQMVEKINSGAIFLRPEPIRSYDVGSMLDIIGHVSDAKLTDEGIEVTVTQLDTPNGELMELFSKYLKPPLIGTSVGTCDENNRIVEANLLSVSPGPFPKPEDKE